MNPANPCEKPKQPPSSAAPAAWHWVIAIPLAAALVYLALRGVDWRAVRMTLARTNAAYLAVAVAISCVSLLVRSLRWRILLNAEGHFRVATVFWASMAVFFGSAFRADVTSTQSRAERW